MAENWAVTTPLDTDFISLGDDNIREMKVAIQASLRGGTTEGTESIFPGSAPTTAPVFRYRGLKGTTGARPAFGQYGLFFDTTRNALQRDSGSAWEDIGTMIPAGTVMVFYQAAAPTGWTAVAVNDKFLRVVTAGGTGGTTGGTVAASTSLVHTHEQTKTTHYLETDTNRSNVGEVASTYVCAVDSGAPKDMSIKLISGSGALNNMSDIRGRTDTASESTVNTGNGLTGAFAYADIIVATKD